MAEKHGVKSWICVKWLKTCPNSDVSLGRTTSGYLMSSCWNIMFINILQHAIPQTAPPGLRRANVDIEVNLFILQLPSHSHRRFTVRHKTGRQSGVQQDETSDVRELYNEARWLESLVWCKGRYTLSVKLSDFTLWRHTWRKNWVNCAVLIGNSAGLRTVLSSRLSHR
jgi:hypothetical protein